MRIRNGYRFPIPSNSDGSISQAFPADELEEIEVTSFTVIDEEKFKEISQKMISDLHNYVSQTNYINNHAPDENSSSKLDLVNKKMRLAQASPSQTMANIEDAVGEDSGKGKSNLLADNEMGENFSNAAINHQQATLVSSSSRKVIIGSVSKTGETNSLKRIRNICQHLKQSESSDPNGGKRRLCTEVTRVRYDLRPRHMGRVINPKNLDCVGNDNQMPTDTDNNMDDTLIIDMLNEEIKKKLKGSLDKRNTID